MSNSDNGAIVVEGLTKRYGNLVAVNNISFVVKRGEVFAFLGPNGAGKTTTVEIIETLRTPTAGKVTVLGLDVVGDKGKIIPRIGVLPQSFNSFDRITVRETIRYYARLFGVSRSVVDDLIALTHLEAKRDVQFRNLSGGLKQRLGIAIALVNDPEIVFLDEPTTGLDPHARRAVWDTILGLKAKGKTIFLTTHYMEEAEVLADTVGIISKGKLAAMGSPSELIERNARHLSLTLKSAPAGAQRTINAMGFESAQDDQHNLKVQVRDSEDVHKILVALKQDGSPLPGVDVRKPNLEEVFLTLTGESLGDEDRAEGAPR